MNLAKKIFCAFILLTSLQSIAKIEAVIEVSPLNGNQNMIGKLPVTKESEVIVSREQYILSYNKMNRSPNWVAWKLDSTSMGNSGRSNNFQQDNDLENYFNQNDQTFHAVTATEYKGSCFDRGHQVPSADRTSSVEDNHATFLMSNMLPQTPYLNQVVWAYLENYTRDLVKKQNKKAYIIAGPIFDDNFGSIGPNKNIRVPSKSFKVIFILDQNQNPEDINRDTPNISVVMPNTLKDGSKPDFSHGCKQIQAEALAVDPTAKVNWEKYKTTVDEIEKSSGIKIIEN
jgi:endonuclease G